MCLNCVLNCFKCVSDDTCEICQPKNYLASPYVCEPRKNLTATLTPSLDPQSYLLYFSDVWNLLFNQINQIFSLEISGVDPGFYSYKIWFESNVLMIYFNFSKFVNSDNILKITLNHPDSDYEEFLLIEKTYEIHLSPFCPIPKTYVSSKTIFI